MTAIHEERTFGAESVPTLTAMRTRKAATETTVAVMVTAAADDESATRSIRCAIEGDLMKGPALVDELAIVDASAGRGRALRAALAESRASMVVWLDGGIRNFSPRIVVRMLAPLLLEDSLAFVKGFTSKISPKSGGRVADHGLARPLLAAHFPELDGFFAPFTREGAARAALLRLLPFAAGEGVDAGLLIDALRVAGPKGMAQAEMGSSLHRTVPVTRFDSEIASTIVRRAEEWGRIRPFADATVHPLLVRDPEAPGDLPPLEPRTHARPRIARRLLEAAT